MKMLESVTIKMLQTQTALNNPEERSVTDRSMTSKEPHSVPRVPGTVATPIGTPGGVIRLGVKQEDVFPHSHPPYIAVA